MPALPHVNLTKGTALPKVAKANDWFYNSETKVIYQFRGGAWAKAREEACNEASTCGALLFLDLGKYKHLILDAKGEDWKAFSNSYDSFTCEDKITIVDRSDWRYFISAEGKILSQINTSECPETIVDEIRGQKAYCVPLYNTFNFYGPGGCDQVGDYGYLGTNGTWLIEPKFSQPFKFENGIANVKWHNRDFQIDDKGAWLE